MMFGLLQFYLFWLLVAFCQAMHKNYGGKDARDGQFPFIAYLSDDKYYCGASIIHERWVLTAAHCLRGKETENSIKVGTVGDPEFGTAYKVKKFYPHPDFIVIPENENNGLEYVVNDIGLVHLASNITFNDKVQPIALATEEDGTYENARATLAGWGSAYYGGGMQHHLRYINVRVLTHKECRRAWPYADKHICTSNQEKQGACDGDSGSPLVVGNVQIGIASTGDTYCQSLKPDLYTEVASFVPWIKNIMSHHGGDVLADS